MLDFEIERPKYRVIAIGAMYDDDDDDERFDKKLEHLLNCGDDAGYLLNRIITADFPEGPFGYAILQKEAV